ncbi:unnamed protein product [Cylicostephanus goldi]|uniref:Uncharacterized protein n=1 Tax=Cylicostephanus goldi TaxID=71465 RepID=A0A3P7R1J2_CYLGO|nr:unnamed protein product [Cylicostephanus goldi]
MARSVALSFTQSTTLAPNGVVVAGGLSQSAYADQRGGESTTTLSLNHIAVRCEAKSPRIVYRARRHARLARALS